MKAFEEVERSAKTNPKPFHKYVNNKTKVRVGIAELHTGETKAISDGEGIHHKRLLRISIHKRKRQLTRMRETHR